MINFPVQDQPGSSLLVTTHDLPCPDQIVLVVDLDPVGPVAHRRARLLELLEHRLVDAHRPGEVDAAVHDGDILTNYHVVKHADSIIVRLSDRREFKAKVIGDDPSTDIAVVQIKAKDLTQISLGNSSDLQVGDYVVAIGNPLGLQHTATFGIVSALGRPNSGGTSDGDGGESGIGKYDDFIQPDAAINPGNSGGPLVNLRGQLVGVNTAIATTNGGNIGIGFAIPVDEVNRIVTQLIRHGTVVRPTLGVALAPDQLTRRLGMRFAGADLVPIVQMRKSLAARLAVAA